MCLETEEGRVVIFQAVRISAGCSTDKSYWLQQVSTSQACDMALLLGPFVFVGPSLVVVINLLARRLWVTHPLGLGRWRLMVVDDTCCSGVRDRINHVVLQNLVYEHRNKVLLMLETT